MTLTTKSKTSMIIAGSMVALAFAFASPNVAMADHPLSVPWGTWASDGVSFYYDNTLSNLKIDGSTGQFAKADAMLDSAMAEWTSQSSDFWLSRDLFYDAGDPRIYALSLTSTGPSAQAKYPNTSGETYVRFNTDRDFYTTGSCFLWYAWNMEWLANHEFGHTAGLGHSDDLFNHSVMYGSCTGGWEQVQSADATQLDSLY